MSLPFFLNVPGDDGAGGAVILTPGIAQSGAGPYTMAALQQLFEYGGSTASVVVELPTPPNQLIPTSGYVVALMNRGTGAATLLPEYFGVSIDADPIVAGETRWYIYSGDLLTYRRAAISQAGSSGGAPAIPQGPFVLATDANIVVTWADAGATMIMTAGIARTITLPLITAAEVGRIMITNQRFPFGSSAAVTVVTSGGQYIGTGSALSNNASAGWVACELNGGAYGWLRF